MDKLSDKLAHLVIAPCDSEIEEGVFAVHRVSSGKSALRLIVSKAGVSVTGELSFRSRQDLDVFAKALAMAWREHERRKNTAAIQKVNAEFL